MSCPRHGSHRHEHPETPPPSYDSIRGQGTRLGPWSPTDPKPFDGVMGVVPKPISVVETHAEGEAYEVVVGGIKDVSGRTMHEKQYKFFRKHGDDIHRLLNEPRGRCGKNAVFLLNPIDSRAERSLIFSKNDEIIPMSVSGIIAAVNVLAGYPHAGGPFPTLPTTRYYFETVAGKVRVEADYETDPERGPRCVAVTVHNAPAIVFKLDYAFNVPGLGTVKADIAFGGAMCAFVDASSVGLKIEMEQGNKLVQTGEKIKRALNKVYNPTHPLDPTISGVRSLVFTMPLRKEGERTVSRTATVVSPGRLDRSPSGTATSARLAILYARGEIGWEVISSRSLTAGEYLARLRGEGNLLGKYKAVLPSIRGRGWVTGFKQMVRDKTDPYPRGFRGADQWGPDASRLETSGADSPEVMGLGVHMNACSIVEPGDENWNDDASTQLGQW